MGKKILKPFRERTGIARGATYVGPMSEVTIEKPFDRKYYKIGAAPGEKITLPAPTAKVLIEDGIAKKTARKVADAKAPAANPE